MNLSLSEEALTNFHVSLMSSGQSETEDVSNMDELFTDIAEAADGIERAWKYANDLSLKIDPSHWLFDYSVGLARILVGLGDDYIIISRVTSLLQLGVSICSPLPRTQFLRLLNHMIRVFTQLLHPTEDWPHGYYYNQ